MAGTPRKERNDGRATCDQRTAYATLCRTFAQAEALEELVSKLRTGLDVHGGQIPALLQSKLGADRNLYGRKQHLDKRSKGAKHQKSYLIAAHGSQDQDQSKDSGSVGVQAR